MVALNGAKTPCTKRTMEPAGATLLRGTAEAERLAAARCLQRVSGVFQYAAAEENHGCLLHRRGEAAGHRGELLGASACPSQQYVAWTVVHS